MAKEVSFVIKIDDNGSAKRVTADAEELGRVIRGVQAESERLKSDILTWSQASQAIDALQDSIDELQGVMADLSSAYQVQLVAETQLATIMRQRMNSTNEEIQRIKDFCSAQQELGVIGDEVQLSGAQQMATFLKEKQSLETLIPAMNNLIAQQNGLNATNQDAVSIGNMMGKAMQGQVEVLQRVGVTFDESQKQVLQFGTESERAAMLAEVITANVGNMNAELAKTDAGQQKQLENTLGDVKEQLGGLVQGALPFVTIAAQTMACVTNASKFAASLAALSAAFSISSIKATALAIHEKIVSVAQNMMAASGYAATAGTAAMTVAVTALYAALTMGISVSITGLVALFSSMGDEADDAAQDVDLLKESTDAFGNASSNAKAEIDMEISSLGTLINGHKNASKKVSELNRKYGESFGYHRTAAEWYDTLIAKSKVYCEQVGYEAQAKVLASQIAAKQLEKESKESERYQLGQQYWDGNGHIHYNYENAAGGKNYYDQLGGEINKLTGEINTLQKQYDSAIAHMVSAQKKLDASRTSVDLSRKNLKDVSDQELTDNITQLQNELNNTSRSNAAERTRLNKEIGRLKKEQKRREDNDQKQQGVSTPQKTPKKTKSTTKVTANDTPITDPKTLEDVGRNISIYEARLKKTNKDDGEKIKLLTGLIAKYKALQNAIQEEIDAADHTVALDTLEGIDAEIQYQQKLRGKASKENLAKIDKEIKRLKDLKTAFEDSSHVALGIEQIETYEQLDNEIAFYQKKLKSATATERVEIQKRIKELERLRGKWDDVLSAMDKPAGIGSLNSMEELDRAISYYSERQRKASGVEVENIQRTINALQAKRDALTRVTELPAMQQETAELDGLSGKRLKMELELIGIEGIKDKIRSLQKMLDDTKNPLGEEQRKEVTKLIQTWGKYEKVLKKSSVKFSEAWAGIKGIGGGVESITDALNGNGNAWQMITGVVDGAIQIYDGVKGVIQIIDDLSAALGISNAVTAASGAAAATAASAKTAAAPEEVAAVKAEAMAYRELAASEFMAAHAYIPFAGAGIAAGFIGMMQGLVGSVAVTPFANGGIVYGPTLALMGEYAGAKNNPEVIAPLNKLKSLIGNNGGGGGVYELKVKGRDLVAVLANETRINRKGTNIKI
nr:MAG TPA: tape measure protein [Bacteriophage sp.]